MLGIVVAGLVVAFVTVESRGAGDDPLDKVQSMRHPAANAELDREQALGVAQDFVTRFNTYGPQLLAADHTMPKYEQLTEEMTSKFAAVFSKMAPAAEATVRVEHVRSIGHVYAAGVSSIDADTAQVIVGGTVTFGYRNPRKKGSWLDSDAQPRRFVVSLDKQHGRWLVDDLQNIDYVDSHGNRAPSFADSTGVLPGGSSLPSGGATPGGGGGSPKGGSGGGKR